MPDGNRNTSIVINTSPIIALIAGLGDLELLNKLYSKVIVPFEVCKENTVDNHLRFGADVFTAANWIEKITGDVEVSPLLQNLLDRGEAAVIQTALNSKIDIVCIDDAAGRRIARLNGLAITGSMGILVRGKKEGYLQLLKPILDSMISQGVWISQALYERILCDVKEL
jgi:predicted nucleic acid-binding protein